MPDFNKILKPGAVRLLRENDGIYTYLNEEFETLLNKFLPGFESIRTEENEEIFIDPGNYPELPFGEPGFEWYFRQKSLKIVKKLLKDSSNADIFEIGSYNSWLTNRLAGMGHQVLAADYFTDERDGLQSKKYYKNKWTSIQMDLADLSIFQPAVFDIIIINHGLQFLPQPHDFTRHLKLLLKENGRIILLGLSLYRNPSKKAGRVQQFRQYFSEKYQFEMVIHEAKNYLDFTAKKVLEDEGFILRPYSSFWLQNLAAKIIKTKPGYWYGVFDKPA